MRRLLVAIAAVAAFGVLAAPAMAGPLSMANGFGKTADGASVGFNAKDDETGSFNYVGETDFAVTLPGGSVIPAGSDFIGHCFSYTAVRFFDRPDLNADEARLFAQCRGFFFVA